MTVLPDQWPIINRIRDAGDLLTIEEKQHMHNLVVRYKRTGVIFAADLIWLSQADENFAATAPRRKGGARED
jgi:hypothetical protein